MSAAATLLTGGLIGSEGDAPAPNFFDVYGDITRAVKKQMPQLNQAILGQLMPTAQAEYDVARVYSPKHQQLQYELLQQYAPVINRLMRGISEENALASAINDQRIVDENAKLLGKYAQAEASADPAFDAFRKSLMNSLAGLVGGYGSVTPGGSVLGNLTPTEQEDILRGLNRMGVERGSPGAQSASETVARAMEFGKQGVDRSSSRLSAALNAVANLTPMLKSSIDPNRILDPKQTVSDWSRQYQTGIRGASGQPANLAGNMMGAGANYMAPYLQAETSRMSDDEATLQTMLAGSQILGNLSSAATGWMSMGGMGGGGGSFGGVNSGGNKGMPGDKTTTQPSNFRWLPGPKNFFLD